MREFEFTDQDFQVIRKLIHRYAGIALADNKQELVYSRLARRLRATGMRSFTDYLALLQGGVGAEWDAFVNSLTTNLTSFFRETHHFDLLAAHLRSIAGFRPLRLWCAACSTGEEAYSLAMTVIETCGPQATVSITASDLDSHALAAARAGRFKPESLNKLSAARIERFFIRELDGHVQVRPELQRMIEFRRINLMDAHYAVPTSLDAIFCRNVMIYFDRDTQRAVLKKFAPLLRDDGLLFAGHSESFHHSADLFKLRGQTVYQKVCA